MGGGGCCVLVAKSLGVCKVLCAVVACCRHARTLICFSSYLFPCAIKQNNKDLPLIFKQCTQAHAHAHVRTHTLLSKLMVSLGSHPKATGVWEKRFLEKGFIIRTFAH